MTVGDQKLRVHHEAEKTRRATAVVTPFVRQFDAWHIRSALLFGQLMSGKGTRDEVLLDIRRLTKEVDSRYEQFKRATKNEPPHGRIRDIDSAFRRLLEALNSTDRPDKQ